MKDSVRVARNPVELFSTIPPEIKNIHSHKIFQWFPENFTKYLFNQNEQNYKYFILQNICKRKTKNTVFHFGKNSKMHWVRFLPTRSSNIFCRSLMFLVCHEFRKCERIWLLEICIPQEQDIFTFFFSCILSLLFL